MTKLPDGMATAEQISCIACDCAGKDDKLCPSVRRTIEDRDAQWAAERDRLAARLAEVERERGQFANRILELTNAVAHSGNDNAHLKAEVADLRKQLATVEARVWREAAQLLDDEAGAGDWVVTVCDLLFESLATQSQARAGK